MTIGLISLGLQNYLGLVASRARMIQTTSPDTTNKFLMARSAHFSTQALTSIQFLFSNFFNNGALVGGSSDQGLGASATISAGAEFNGSISPVTFGGSTSGTIPNAGTLLSDPVSVSIPASTLFWVRSLWNNAAGTLYNSWQNSFLGEATTISASAVTDQTLSGTIVNSGSPSGISYPPFAVIGRTTTGSVVIIDDSTGAGFDDVEDSSSSNTGFNAKVGKIARSLGNTPFVNLSAGGQTASGWASATSARRAILPYCSEIISGLGVNDLRNGGSSAQLITDLQTIFALSRPGQKIFQTTITPDTGMTSPEATQRATFNTAVRNIISGSTGFYDVASAVEASLNSNTWISNSDTADGLHPSVAGYALIASSGVIGPVVFP